MTNFNALSKSAKATAIKNNWWLNIDHWYDGIAYELKQQGLKLNSFSLVSPGKYIDIGGQPKEIEQYWIKRLETEYKQVASRKAITETILLLNFQFKPDGTQE